MNNIVNPILAGSLIILIFLSLTNPNKVNVKANRWLSMFIICILLVVLDELYLTIQRKQINDLISIISNSAAFHIAPVFYLSISYFINPNKTWRFKDNLHFLFGFVFLIILVCNFFLYDKTIQSTNYDFKITNTLSALSNILNALFSIQIILYCYFIYLKLKKHHNNIKLFRSYTEIIDLKWLRNIVVTVNLLFLFWVVDMLFKFSTDNFLIMNLLVLFEIFFITYHFIKQKEIYPFSYSETNEIIEIIYDYDLDSSKKQLIQDDKLIESKIELSQLMTTKKLFLDPEICLIKLAAEMDCTPHIISYIINNGYNENFYQFINRYRIDEAKKMILNPKMDYLSLLGIGFEVGFNSKSTFNSTFKKISGQTPSEYKKSNALK